MRKAIPILIVEPDMIWKRGDTRLVLLATGQKNTHGHDTYRALVLNYRLCGPTPWSLIQIRDQKYERAGRVTDPETLRLIESTIAKLGSVVNDEDEEEKEASDVVEEDE